MRALKRAWERLIDVSHLPIEQHVLATEILRLYLVGFVLLVLSIGSLQFLLVDEANHALFMALRWAYLPCLLVTIVLARRGKLTLSMVPVSFWLIVLLLIDMKRLGGLTAFSAMAITPSLLLSITYAWRALIASNAVIIAIMVTGHLIYQSAHPVAYPYRSDEAMLTFVLVMISMTVITAMLARITERSFASVRAQRQVFHQAQSQERARRIEVEHTEELARLASLTKGRFLANMSHELRTPLSAILGYAELLQEDFEALDQIDALYGQDAQRIEHSARHLLHLINAILDLSRIEAERMPLQPEVLPAFALIEIVRGALDDAMDDHGVTCSLDASLERARLELDAVRTAQLLAHAALEQGARGELVLSRRGDELGSLRVTFTRRGESEVNDSIRELHALLRAALTELLGATFTLNERGWVIELPQSESKP